MLRHLLSADLRLHTWCKHAQELLFFHKEFVCDPPDPPAALPAAEAAPRAVSRFVTLGGRH